MNKPARIWFVVALILATISCTLPGLSNPSETSNPASNSLPTIIAGTAYAAATQTALVAPATSTPVPSQTATPTSTPTATAQVSTEGTSLVQQSDGSTQFTDYQGGYSLVIPADWLPLRVNEKEYMEVWTLPEVSDPNVQSMLAQIQKSDPKTFRVFGLDLQATHLQAGFATNFSVGWDRNDNSTIPQEISLVQKTLAKSAIPFKVTYADSGTTSTHIPIGIIELATKLKTLNLYQKQVIFKLKTGVLSITLSTVSSLKGDVSPGFDLMTDQIVMLP